jgi:PAS domain S-box-containing protein
LGTSEEKLRESEARYKAILDAVPDLMFRISRDGKYLDFKGEGAHQRKCFDEIVGKHLQDILPPDVACKNQEAIARALESKTVQTCEYQLLTPCGVRDYEARIVVSGDDEVLAIVRDITERKQAEEVLRLSSKRDRLLAQTLARIRQSLNLDQILQTTVNEVRQFLQADRVFIALNHSKGESRIVAESVDEQYPTVLGWKTHDETYLQELRTLLTSHRVRIVEDIARIPASPELIALYEQFQTRATLAVPIMLGEELIGALVANQCRSARHWTSMEIDLLQQMSEQVAIAIQQAQLYQELAKLNTSLERQVEERTAQLKQKMQELQEINRVNDVVLHMVSHDLRTSVIGNLMVLNNLLHKEPERTFPSTPSLPHSLSPSLIPVPRSIIERMIQGNERQLAMIEPLLEIHAKEVQGVILQKEMVNFGTLLEAILRDLEPTLKQNQVKITNLVSKDLPLVIADPVQLQKVIVNLFTHSWQSNPPGLSFILKAKEKLGMIRCTIQDNGIGMSKLECERLFDLYVRTPQTGSLTTTGLKMFLCRQIIKAHGGEIGVSSNRKRGITFWFTIPL